ncbi:dispersed gene family protein 1 (DGF-1), putative, partial [Trypanosoma cruzi marinkellei]
MHMFYVYKLSVGDHSVFSLLNNTMASGASFLYLRYVVSVSDRSVLRVVGSSGIVACAIYAYKKWFLKRSSWLDWHDNDVGLGAMFHESESTFVIIDSSSVVTLTGCKMGSTGLSRPLLSHAEAGYRFVAGCLTVAGRVVRTAAELELNGITDVTTVAACGECTKDGDCFAPLTTAVIDCRCECAAGGHGDVCVPAPVPDTMASGASFLYLRYVVSVSDRSVLRVVGSSGIVACAIYAYKKWFLKRSSWLDWHDNDVGLGAMFHESESTFVIIDSSSVVTLTGCKMGSTGLSRPLLSHAEAGYRFVAGCLTVAGRVVRTAAELELNGITDVTTVAACGECTKDGDCFAPLTTAVIDCRCECAAGGHGDVC